MVRAFAKAHIWRIEIRGTRQDWRWHTGVERGRIIMGGIQFLTDEKGRKTAAVIDLKVHRALWEDIQDVLMSRSRRHEKGVSLDKVKAGLIASGKLRG